MATKAGIPKGTRDFLPLQTRQRQYVMDRIREQYEKHGFDPIESPAIENIETLMGKYGEEGDMLLFKILKRGEKAASGECDLGLRYDLTVPLARFVAMHQNALPAVFKRYQIQPVYRADRPGHGRFREFYQCDVDIVGAKAPFAEISLIRAASDVLKALHFPPSVLSLNDRRILRSVIAASGIDLSLETTAVTAVDKLDKIAEDGVLEELIRRGIAGDSAKKLLELIKVEENNELTAQKLRQSLSDFPDALNAVDEAESILRNFEDSQHLRCILDPSLARGLNYYTGAIFEIRNSLMPSSVAGGGRYDKLIGMFAGRDIAACGLSLGFERLCVVMQEQNLFPDLTNAPDLLVTCFNADGYRITSAFAAEMRSEGLRVEEYCGDDKLAKQFKYANERHIPWVATIGTDEVAENKVSLKNMLTGEQITCPRNECGDVINGTRP